MPTEQNTTLNVDQVEQKYLTVSAAAKYLGIGTSYLYHKVSAREIPFYKVGRAVRFTTADLDKYAKRTEPVVRK